MSKERFLLPYLPDIAWLKAFLKAKEPILDLHAHFIKQSPRNRTHILGPNGVQTLVIPIQGRNKRQTFGEVKIAYADKWQRVHFNAIKTAYGAAPFYDYIIPELESLYRSQPKYLFEFNEAVLACFLKLLKVKKDLVFSSDYDLEMKEIDRREDFLTRDMTQQSYPQVFQEKFDFQAGLSALDLMMNQLTECRKEIQI